VAPQDDCIFSRSLFPAVTGGVLPIPKFNFIE